MTKGGEVVSIFAGGAGVNIGTAIWELYCLEHGIGFDGVVHIDPDPNALNAFFNIKPIKKCSPRAIFIDTDPCALDEVRCGNFRSFFNPKNLISGKEDSANCFAKGYLTIGREMADLLLERVRISSEECAGLQGFLIYRAAGGGTGSGLGSYFLEKLADDYKKTSKIEVSTFSLSKLSSVVVEPYNAMLATHSSMNTVNCSFRFDNDAVYDICDHELNNSRPTFRNLNCVFGQVLSAITSQFSFEGGSNVNVAEFQTNLVPYPRIHFPLIGYAPFVAPDKAHHECYTVSSITNSCFNACNQVIKCDSSNGKYVSCCLLYRGNVSTSEINSTLSTLKMKKSIRFVSWIPTKFKIGLSLRPPVSLPDSDIATADKDCVMIANNTAVREAWKKLNHKFDLIYSKKAFIHWYVAEGLEESDFLDARMDLETLIADYDEVESEA